MNQTTKSWSNTSDKNSLSPCLYRADYVYLFKVAYYALLLCGAVLYIMVVFVMIRSGKIQQYTYRRIYEYFKLSWFSIYLSRIYCFSWAFQFFGTFNSPRATLHHPRLSGSSTTPAPHWAIFNSLVAIAWDRHRNVLRLFHSLAPRHLKTYFKLVAAIWIYAFITSVPLFIALGHTPK